MKKEIPSLKIILIIIIAKRTLKPLRDLILKIALRQTLMTHQNLRAIMTQMKNNVCKKNSSEQERNKKLKTEKDSKKKNRNMKENNN